MKINARKRGEIVLLELTGALTFPDATAELAQKMSELLAAGERLFVLNMLGVPWLDSSGLGEVVACGKRALAKDGIVKLVLEKRPYTLFTYAHMEKMFEMYPDEETALASFEDRSGPTD
jgi:anti-sigma B factor antagonist